MEHASRVRLAAAGVVVLFVCVQLGALAMVDPYVAADAQPVEDPSDPGNVALFFAVILVATGAMLAAIKFDLDLVIRGFVLFACGWITWLVVATLTRPLGAEGAGAFGSVPAALAVGLPVLAGVLVVAALLSHPEWYVVDAAGILLGAGSAGLFGLAFTPGVTVVFLVVLAVYDAVSVYGTEHMLALAEGVSDLNLPVLLVVPTVPGFSLLGDAGAATALDSATDGDDAGGPAPEPENDSTAAADGDDADVAESDDDRRDAIFIGLGDAVMPTILVASAVAPHGETATSIDLPLLALNVPALGALFGTLAGLVVLLWLVLRGRAHAGLPLLNGGAIAGYLLGALASGIALADALALSP